MGPLILDLTGLVLSSEEREILQHPQVGGIIFFSRNYESPEQFKNLVLQIHDCSKQRLLLTVDQEGGRVQRFLSGFTRLPQLGKIGQIYEKKPAYAIYLAQLHGWLLASELLTLKIDLSFAPVLDLNNNLNQVIGARSFHADPYIVTQLARGTIQGMHHAGMCTVGKHFPGHGSVTTDTHTHLAVDSRDYKTIEASDLIPFAQLSNDLDAIMVSHIVYRNVDPLPCGFSAFWLQTVLRKNLNFSGAIFTDDLSMHAAQMIDSISERIQHALHAGCDGLLICNNRKDAISALEYLESSSEITRPSPAANRLQKLFPRRTLSGPALRQCVMWRDAVSHISKLND